MNSNTGIVHIERYNRIKRNGKEDIASRQEEIHNIQFIVVEHENHAGTCIHLRDGAKVTIMIYEEWDIAEIERPDNVVRISHKRRN